MPAHDETVRLGRPMIDIDDIQAVAAVLATGDLVQGRVVEALERKLSGFLGDVEVVAVSSGTAALHLALKSVGVGPGDEVVVPAFTFPATANVVEWLGARPVFCDIAPGSFNAGPREVLRVLSRRTRAVMPVHAFGEPADVRGIAHAIRGAGRGKQPAIIEDAACALGAERGGQAAGTIGDAGCFSFHPRKIMTTGEGGLVITRRAPLARRIRALRSHGLVRGSRGFDLVEPGLNYRMTDFQAALGLAQLSRLGTLIAQRAALAEAYREALDGLPGLTLPPIPLEGVGVAQSFVVTFRSRRLRARAEAALGKHGIETTFGTHCVPLLGWYRRRYGHERRDFPNAVAARERTLSLPLHPSLTAKDQARVIRCLEEALL
ncbi:MAG: DegT/DnrJ/EryC1/StrS family aminotransferase [Deltaproteobacteria bacterium]|nr:DegT/DnrJ/EryC1/StrS family aminotransferase [Deltaproteobacteria bacterium]